jgi:hypothetical protein
LEISPGAATRLIFLQILMYDVDSDMTPLLS